MQRVFSCKVLGLQLIAPVSAIMPVLGASKTVDYSHAAFQQRLVLASGAQVSLLHRPIFVDVSLQLRIKLSMEYQAAA